jgi:hypothetical protein
MVLKGKSATATHIYLVVVKRFQQFVFIYFLIVYYFSYTGEYELENQNSTHRWNDRFVENSPTGYIDSLVAYHPKFNPEISI